MFPVILCHYAIKLLFMYPFPLNVSYMHRITFNYHAGIIIIHILCSVKTIKHNRERKKSVNERGAYSGTIHLTALTPFVREYVLPEMQMKRDFGFEQESQENIELKKKKKKRDFFFGMRLHFMLE